MITGIFRHRITLSILVLFGLLISCGKTGKPDGILSHEEMVKTMMEVYIAEQKVIKLGLSSDSSRVVFEKINRKVFEKAGISDSVFKKSFDYYFEKPLEPDQIYTALVDSLNLKEQRLNISSSHNKQRP